MYTIRSIPGKGQGMFANKDIKAGSRILADELLLSIAESKIDEGIGERISVSLHGLPPEQQQQFETLHCPDHPTWTPAVSRFLANCFEVEAPGSGIFLKASRINNSCFPNAFFSWNQNLHRLTVHAMVDIPIGDEITVCYIFPFYSLQIRRDLFREHYVFECDCPACHVETGIGRRGELRRRRMETLYMAIDKTNDGPSNNDQKELEMVLEFIRLAEDERLDGQFLSCIYSRAKKCYDDRGSEQLALEYAEMEVETNMRLLGDDHAVTQESARDLDELKTRLAMVQQTEENGENLGAL
ncbi:hypothetical protein HO133_008246 [Letharia lupina]|uniref:SET domain-containing protein n=1 Tax=Letharia lupina TaxID=560253 RepID=A0A8H6FHN8_9LECA|nr:uncharacterized protein HO133_008246 [Letharia lupina]KAF6228516.1 hypothetical protein HO133_008246 [Letharia lupina]